MKTVDRRTVLASATGTVGMAGLVTPESAAAQTFGGSTDHDRPNLENIEHLIDAGLRQVPLLNEGRDFDSEASESIELISTWLRKYTTYTKNEIASLFSPVEFECYEIVREHSRGELSFKPTKLEYLASTLTDHVDAFLALRDRAQELEVLALQGALNFQREENKLAVIEAQNNLDESDGWRRSNSMFEPAYNKQTGKITGLEKNAAPHREQAKINFADLKVAEGDLLRRIYLFSKNGGALNYVQRMSYVRKRFKQEFTEAYSRARALYYGLRFVLDFNNSRLPTLPQPEDGQIGFLTEFVIWARRAAYELEISLTKRSRTTLAFPIRENAGNGGLLQDDAYTKQLSDDKALVFRIEKDHFRGPLKGIKNPRIRGVDLARYDAHGDGFGNTLPALARVSYSDAVDLRDEGNKKIYSIDPQHHQSFTQFSNVKRYAEKVSESFYNLSPFAQWKIELSDREIFGNGYLNYQDDLSNLVLFLEVSYDSEVD